MRGEQEQEEEEKRIRGRVCEKEKEKTERETERQTERFKNRRYKLQTTLRVLNMKSVIFLSHSVCVEFSKMKYMSV